jgi:hypothetical protein
MKRIEDMPSAFAQYWEAGGVLEFTAFRVDDASEAVAAEAIVAALRGQIGAVDALRSLGSRVIDRQSLLGKWHDPATGLLIKRGRSRFADGREVEDPAFLDTDGDIVSHSQPVRDPEAGGDLAFAFALPPAGLRLWRSQIQPLFDDMMDFTLPRSKVAEIRDWHSPELPGVDGYFAGGARSWGLFLFSIYVPELKRLTIVAGAPGD